MRYAPYILTIIIVIMVLGTITYHTNRNREAYLECLRITEKLLAEDPKRISTPYCRI